MWGLRHQRRTDFVRRAARRAHRPWRARNRRRCAGETSCRRAGDADHMPAVESQTAGGAGCGRTTHRRTLETTLCGERRGIEHEGGGGVASGGEASSREAMSGTGDGEQFGGHVQPTRNAEGPPGSGRSSCVGRAGWGACAIKRVAYVPFRLFKNRKIINIRHLQPPFNTQAMRGASSPDVPRRQRQHLDAQRVKHLECHWRHPLSPR